MVDAVLAAQPGNPAGAARTVKQLQAWVGREDWSTILPAFARCVRITRDQKQIFTVDEKAFQEREEEKLYAAIQKAEAALKEQGSGASIDAVLTAFLQVIPAINAFFDKVLVMADDTVVRENRLALLQRVAALPRGVADLSKLEGF